MFVLSRKTEESVIIDGFSSLKNALKVTVLEVKGGRVRLGFEVNADAPVHDSLVVCESQAKEVLMN